MKSDRELIEAINKGQSDAFEVLYYRYRDWIYKLAWRFSGNQNDALDVLQETFTYFLGKFPGFELTASMTTFFYPVVKHISINIRIKNSRFVSDMNLLPYLKFYLMNFVKSCL
jgi:RNA polymerase sigma-70 factor (ECF subfamily)